MAGVLVHLIPVQEVVAADPIQEAEVAEEDREDELRLVAVEEVVEVHLSLVPLVSLTVLHPIKSQTGWF